MSAFDVLFSILLILFTLSGTLALGKLTHEHKEKQRGRR